MEEDTRTESYIECFRSQEAEEVSPLAQTLTPNAPQHQWTCVTLPMYQCTIIACFSLNSLPVVRTTFSWHLIVHSHADYYAPVKKGARVRRLASVMRNIPRDVPAGPKRVQRGSEVRDTAERQEEILDRLLVEEMNMIVDVLLLKWRPQNRLLLGRTQN